MPVCDIPESPLNALCVGIRLLTRFSTGLLSFFLIPSPTAVLARCEIKRKKKSRTQHITIPQSRWEIMPHMCTLSNALTLAFFRLNNVIRVYETLRTPWWSLWRNGNKNLFARSSFSLSFRDWSASLCHCNWGNASLATESTMLIRRVHLGGLGVGSQWMEKRIKRKRTGKVQIPAAQLSANGRVQMAWRERAFDWGTKRHLWTTNSISHKCTDAHTHSCAMYCSY